MAYATRPMHDADSHIMEPPAWLEPHLAAEYRQKLPVLGASDDSSRQGFDVDRVRRAHADPEYRAEDESQIMLRKNFLATGSFIEDDRPRALELLGFASQLVFDTFTSSHVLRIEREGDQALATEVARGQHRAVLAWCAVDPRLLPVCVVPLGDMPAAVSLAREAIDGGAAALQIGQYCPPGHSPAHVDLEPLWAYAEEAGVPIVLHVAGAGSNVMNPGFFENGLPPVPDFHGGDTNFKSIDYLSIPLPVMQTLNALVIDGVLQRHPQLRVGVIEVGASWIPSWMRMLDSAHEAFRKNEERLQNMEMRPSEYVRRQVRATPYPHEDTGWTIANAGAEVCMFSSDFPHVEGGRNPIGRFERSMDAADTDADAARRFYWDNFVDLLRPVLERRGIPTLQPA
ncbi:MAG TPA: amidohydrolase family protein [Acidimicrobiia bacterium]|nr:amidohydrolase family protein [Acidimicrobiia bacterium]